MNARENCAAPSSTATSADDAKLAEVARKLRSLHDGDVAVVEAIAIGAPAIPVLRTILFERDSAGICEPRRRAAQALSALNAMDVVKEFVAGWERVTDPVERFGDEAVVGAAARALGASLGEEAYAILVSVARRYPVSEVIEALGYYRRADSIPILVAALEDDLARPQAEQALRMLGRAAVPALIQAASRSAANFSGRESPSSIRRRRSALRLILEFGAARDHWERLRELVEDSDDEIAVLACMIGLYAACDTAGRECAYRLVALLLRAQWPLNQEIEDCLRKHLETAREFVDSALSGSMDGSATDIQRARFKRSLRRVKNTGSARDSKLGTD